MNRHLNLARRLVQQPSVRDDVGGSRTAPTMPV